jgi:TolB protein
VFSPDGSKIAFTSFGRGGVTTAIWVMNADGSGLHRISAASRLAGMVDWSPDGSRILYCPCFTGLINQELWTISPDGTDPVQLTDPFPKHDDSGGTYSPRGGKIVFERDVANYSRSSIYIMNADGAGQHQIQADGFQPAWGTNASA